MRRGRDWNVMGRHATISCGGLSGDAAAGPCRVVPCRRGCEAPRQFGAYPASLTAERPSPAPPAKLPSWSVHLGFSMPENPRRHSGHARQRRPGRARAGRRSSRKARCGTGPWRSSPGAGYGARTVHRRVPRRARGPGQGRRHPRLPGPARAGAPAGLHAPVGLGGRLGQGQQVAACGHAEGCRRLRCARDPRHARGGRLRAAGRRRVHRQRPDPGPRELEPVRRHVIQRHGEYLMRKDAP